MAGFAGQLTNLTREYQQRISRVDRASKLEISNRIQNGTPVDEGTARRSWQSTPLDSNPYYFTNSLPYVRMLEYGGYTDKPETEKTIGGFSKQAPQGMVRINAANWREIVLGFARMYRV